jgi:hypothetical protein
LFWDSSLLKAFRGTPANHAIPFKIFRICVPSVFLFQNSVNTGHACRDLPQIPRLRAIFNKIFTGSRTGRGSCAGARMLIQSWALRGPAPGRAPQDLDAFAKRRIQP